MRQRLVNALLSMAAIAAFGMLLVTQAHAQSSTQIDLTKQVKGVLPTANVITGPAIPTHCIKIDAQGRLVDAGSACGSSSGSFSGAVATITAAGGL